MKKTILIIIIFILALVGFQNVEATQKTEYMSQYMATVKYIPKGDLKKDNINENYYSQVYEIYKDGLEIIDYEIQNLNNLPEGSFVADVKTGNQRNKFDRKTLQFKIMIPAEKVSEDFLGNFKVHMNFYGYMYFYNTNGELSTVKEQDDNEQIKIIDNRHSSLILNFIDKDSLEGINGIEAKVTDNTFKEIKNMISNSNGQIYINKIGEGSANININRFPTNYNLEVLEHFTEIGYSEEKEYNILLEHKKGDLKIKDNIENAVFEIYDTKGELLRKI